MIYTKTTTIKDALIENNQVISQALNKLWAAKVDKAPSDDEPTREKVLSDFNFNRDYKTKLDELETTITKAIEELDVDDTANERRYVSSVSEVDGKIVVERAEHLGGIKVLPDTPDTAIDEKDPYNAKFLYTNSEGRLVYYSPSILREGQKVTLATAAQLCTNIANGDLNALNIPVNDSIYIGKETDNEYLKISDASGTIIIKHFVNGVEAATFNASQGQWSTATPPTLTLTANILNTVATTSFELSMIINPQATFDKKVIILRDDDVADNYLDEDHPTKTDKCRLVSRLGVENAINDIIKRINDVQAALETRISNVETALAARVRVLEEEHNHGTAGTSLLAIDADGNEINAVVVDENGNEVPAEIVK